VHDTVLVTRIREGIRELAGREDIYDRLRLGGGDRVDMAVTNNAASRIATPCGRKKLMRRGRGKHRGPPKLRPDGDESPVGGAEIAVGSIFGAHGDGRKSKLDQVCRGAGVPSEYQFRSTRMTREGNV